MADSINFAVIYYSSTGNVHELATAAAQGAEKAGAEVRLRRVGELAKPEAIAAEPGWIAHRDATEHILKAHVDDLLWADAILLGTPARYGSMAGQLKHFIDEDTAVPWREGRLADKVCGAFVSGISRHAGSESALLSLYTVFSSWGGIIVPPGFTDPIQFQLGNPFGTSHASTIDFNEPDEVVLAAARYQAHRMATTAAALKAGRS
ncbi:flavodoxin family protein [Nocardia sp. CC227C]|uniref:flavodoxin family protein n=1 Tax=Nocardia sp. CC227C TaxID=3044562 RepID=UPI00278BF31C|nr:NAD(P)H-dependent oxidoreductase [Nocardia sp. CC227C]